MQENGRISVRGKVGLRPENGRLSVIGNLGFNTGKL